MEFSYGVIASHISVDIPIGSYIMKDNVLFPKRTSAVFSLLLLVGLFFSLTAAVFVGAYQADAELTSAKKGNYYISLALQEEELIN